MTTIISLVKHRFEDGDFTGVPRFDFELRKAIPGLITLKASLWTFVKLYWWAMSCPDQYVIITSSELSVQVPARLKTIVMLHGCAQTHFDRDPLWQNRMARQYCDAQREMYQYPNRVFVSPAQWTSEEFSRHYGVSAAYLIPHWVEMPRSIVKPVSNRLVVIGDWRNFNKGQQAIEVLKVFRPDIEFRILQFTYDTRHEFYQQADLYLCLSLSEGGSYAMSDAVACGLPVVTTDVGNCFEYDVEVISWRDRDQPDVVSAAIDRALARPHGRHFFEDYSLDTWSGKWRDLISAINRSKDVVSPD